MERDIFGEKKINIQRPRTDRFVAPRSTLVDMGRRRSMVRGWEFPDEHTDLWVSTDRSAAPRLALADMHWRRSLVREFPDEHTDFWDPKQAKRINYITYLNEAMEIQQPKGHSSQKDTLQVWPCRPRKKTHLKSADGVLDLPSYRYALCPDLLDWNTDDVLVAALDRKYHQYNWTRQVLAGVGYTLSPVCCCKYDPRGELLALGTVTNVEVHDHALTKRLFINSCLCNVCIITALDWSPTGNSLVTGCSEGMIRGFSRGNENLNSFKCHKPIQNVKISPDARYVVVIEVVTRRVLMLTWPSMQTYYQLDSNCVVTNIDWHPWSSALLGIAAIPYRRNKNVTISLWDVPSNNLKQACDVPSRYSVDTLLFSQRSGEMVLSLRQSEQSRVGSRIVVLSDPDKIVDQCGEDGKYLDRIRTMVFSPDGTKLATATTDEDLIVWNFLPEEDKKKKKSVTRRFSALPVYLDQAMFGRSLR